MHFGRYLEIKVTVFRPIFEFSQNTIASGLCLMFFTPFIKTREATIMQQQ
jgi:hypothetical protein